MQKNVPKSDFPFLKHVPSAIGTFRNDLEVVPYVPKNVPIFLKRKKMFLIFIFLLYFKFL